MPGDGERARGHGGGERADGEVALEVGGAGAAGVADEEHGREIGGGGDEQRADHAARAG